MKYLKHLAAFSLITSLLLGCGGGSSTSGASSYAGVYTGTSTITLRALGATATEVVQLRVVVGVDGQVSVSTPGTTAASCNGPQIPMSIVGNKATASSKNVSCSSKDVSCTVSGTFTYTFAGDSASQTGSAVMNCNVGNVDVSYAGHLRKTA